MATVNISKESFLASRKFYDDKNYPRGMSRSGDFTLNEVQIIENHGVALQALMTKEQPPINDEEAHFVLVCEGAAEANTNIEKAWKKYQNKVLSPKNFHTLFGRTKVDVEDDTSIATPENDSIDLDIDD